MRSTSVPALLLVAACAGGTGVRSPAGESGDGTVGDSSSTIDTIDPTHFSSTGADGSDDATATGASASSSTASATEGSSGSSSAATTAGDGPQVTAISPDDGATGVAADTTIAIDFSAAMAAPSLVADDGSCSGSVQLSTDDFASCEAIADVALQRGDTRAVITPAAALPSTANVRVRVTPDATAADGAPLAATYESAGFVVRYFHTIAIDGVDDWHGDETFATSTMGHSAYVAWDDAYVYLAMRSPDVAVPNDQVWVVVYFGGAAGSSDGVLYNTQQPALPFAAQWHWRWRASNDFTDVLEFDGMSWQSGGWAIAMGDVWQSGELLELRVARSDLGDPDQLELHMGIVREQALDEASWAAFPSGSYVDGYDPDYGEYWSFDLQGSVAPGAHVPLP